MPDQLSAGGPLPISSELVTRQVVRRGKTEIQESFDPLLFTRIRVFEPYQMGSYPKLCLTRIDER